MKPKKQNSTPTKTSKNIKSDLGNDWEFDLYVAGETPETITTLANLKSMCEHLKIGYKINVIDLIKNPNLAKEMQIFAIPTTIRKNPIPNQRLIGDFSNQNDMVSKFGIKEDE